MELAIKQNFKSTSQTYKHFSINTADGVEKEQRGKMEFFFVGNNIDKIDKLVNLFEGGYAAENVDNALSILNRLSGHPHSLPTVIFIESKMSLGQLQKFHQSLSAHPTLSHIPVVLDSSDVSPESLAIYRKCAFLDDIINFSKIDSRILNKVSLLKKIKNAGNHNELAKKVEVYSRYKKDVSISAVTKRAFDILIASLALIIVAPIFAIIALAIRIESKGPIFYIAKRAGRGYKIFNFYKFRTMVVDAESKVQQLVHLNQYNGATDGPVFFKINNDPRVTKVGAFLRNSSLDELPQLINVLLGDMSLVGNRPLPLYEAEALTTDDWAGRFMAPAGITGLWQIKKRGQSDMSVEERINLDIAYANKNNFMYDLWIMANTPTALFQKSNV
jgi:lipopolysaccharide/colanic/teichoic acid biosynthesis glycosyltransferase